MNKRFIIAFVLTSFAAVFHLSADNRHMTDRQIENLTRDTRIVYIDGRPDSLTQVAVRDSVAREMLTFYYDQFRHFDDPAAPYFQFMSRDAALMMGIGGVVRIRGYYDVDGAVPSPGFAPYLISVPHNEENRQLGTTPAGTCIFFTVMGHNSFFGRYMLYIESNFNGYKARDFHLKQAYAKWRDFTLGLAPCTFGDVAAHTPMVDANGPANKIAPVNVLFRYMPTVRDKWVFAIAAEDPSSPAQTSVADSTCHGLSKWMPDVTGFAQYQWGKGQHVRLSGIWRLMTYRDCVAERNRNVSGWGISLSTVAKPMNRMTLYGSYVYGRGFTSIMNDLLIGTYDLVPEKKGSGLMYSPYCYGWHAGMQWNFQPNLFACVSYGQVRYLPSHAVAPDEYRYGQLAVANLFWQPTLRSQFGVEFDWGRRCDMSGASATAKRIGAVAQFSF